MTAKGKKKSKDQEPVISEPKTRPENKVGNNDNKSDGLQFERTVNRVTISFPKGGHLATYTELDIICTHKR